VTDDSTEPPDVVIVAVPMPTAETKPPPLTLATLGSLERHESVAFPTTAPVELIGVAVSCTVLPASIGALGAPLITIEAMLDGEVTPPSAPPHETLDTTARVNATRRKADRKGSKVKLVMGGCYRRAAATQDRVRGLKAARRGRALEG
jgi:hypothetical protein